MANDKLQENGKQTKVQFDTENLQIKRVRTDDLRPSRVHKYVLTVWSLVENVLFGGLTFGWALLVIILKDEGIYEELCRGAGAPNDTQTPSNQNASSLSAPGRCTNQENQLNLVFTVAVVIRAVSGPFIGQMLYKWGVRITRVFMVFVLSGGLLMVAFASSDLPWLLFPGLMCMAIGGEAVFSSNMQAAYLFKAGSSFVASLLSGMFDASASIILLIKLMYNMGIEHKYSFLVMTGIFIVITSVGTICLSPKTFFQEKDVANLTRKRLSVGQTFFTNPEEEGHKTADLQKIPQKVPVPALRDCVMSRVFLSHILWFSVLQLRWYFYLGAFNSWVTSLTHGSQDDVNYYTDVSLYVQLCSIIISLVSGLVLGFERKRFSEKFTAAERRLRPSVILQLIACLLAIALSSVILVPSTDILYFVFILAISLRTLIYGMGAAYIQMIFPVQYFGFLFGVLMLIGGIIGCFQYLLFVWLELAPVGVQKVNILLLVLTSLSLIHPVHIWIRCRRAVTRIQSESNKQLAHEYDFIMTVDKTK